MMEDISEKISALLNSPDGMDKIRAAAASILGDNPNQDNNPPKNENQGISLPNNLLENMGNMQSIARLMGLFKERQEDNRVTLLLALKPHLNSERAKKVDRAVSLLRVASILPVLKEEGLLDTLGL